MENAMSKAPENLRVDERRLAAILAADVAGYSRLMGRNEEATVRDLEAHQAVLLERFDHEVMAKLYALHAGDFDRSVEEAEAAIEIAPNDAVIRASLSTFSFLRPEGLTGDQVGVRGAPDKTIGRLREVSQAGSRLGPLSRWPL